MGIANSSELLLRLYKLGYDNPGRDDWWWPHSGQVETLIGAILTQNTQWNNVEKSLSNLRKQKLLNLDTLATISLNELEEAISPSGFYRAKAANLKALAQKIIEDFDTFERFQLHVSRGWLLERRGIGEETADAILCYACYREAMVVDSYTARLLDALGHPQPNYTAVQTWMMDGIAGAGSEIFGDIPLAQIYARYHGMVVEYCKANKRGRVIEVDLLLVS